MQAALKTSPAWWGLAALSTLVLVVGLVFWDARRVSEEATSLLGTRQRLLALSVASDMGHRVQALERAQPEPTSARARAVATALTAARELENEGRLRVLLGNGDHEGFLASDGALVNNPRLEQAFVAGEPSLVIPTEGLGALGLPEGQVVAGLALVEPPGLRVAVISSASSEALRLRRSQARSAVGIALALLVVLGFGGAGVRQLQQRRALETKLLTQGLAQERDEQLARADRLAAVAALSAGIAHELATPLGVILARVDWLAVKLPPAGGAKTDEALASIRTQVAHMKRVMQGFLALARGDQSERTALQPERLVRSASELVRHRFEAAGVTLEVAPSSGLPEVFGNEPMLVQVLTNLLLNAAQASVAGQTVRLTLELADGQVWFRVDDDGEGLSVEARTRAVEPFFTTRAQAGGSGLGLAVSREIVAHHQGTLRLEARVPRGTSAQVALAAGRHA